jgi:hypothetical protein
MLVVADSSPINILVRIECVSVLGDLFGSVLIPPMVQDELSQPATPPAVRAFISSPPSWLTVRAPTSHEHLPPLDPGEEAAINLARDAHADAILIDDKDGRRVAVRRGLVVVGTLSILELAAERNLLSLVVVAQRLAATNFRLNPKLVQEALRRDAERRGRA